MNPTPPPLSRSIAEEIDVELSSQSPRAHDWSEAQLQAAAEVIQRRVGALLKVVEAHGKAIELEELFHEMSERAEAEDWKNDPTGSGWLSQYADDWRKAAEHAETLTKQALSKL